MITTFNIKGLFKKRISQMNLLKNLILVLLGMIIVCGCSTGFRQIGHYSPDSNIETQILKNYKLGEEKKVYIGDNIIEYSHLKLLHKDSIKFKAIADSNTRVKISKGAIYEVKHRDLEDNGLYICASNHTSGGFHIKINKSGEILDPHPYYKDSFGFHNHAALYVGEAGLKYFSPITEKKEEYAPGSFKQEIVYAGLSGTTLNITYKEYKNDIARPAFFQNITYDLNNSKIIRYKNIKIQIFEASNSQIRYAVLEDGY